MDMPQDISALGRAFDQEADAAGGGAWIEWYGTGIIPQAPGVDPRRPPMVEIRRRDGITDTGSAWKFPGWDRKKGRNSLEPYIERDFDIVAYRFIDENTNIPDAEDETAQNARTVISHAEDATARKLAALGGTLKASGSIPVCSPNNSKIEAPKLAAAKAKADLLEAQWARLNSGRNEELSDELTSAPALLGKAFSHMQARAATYEKPEGERSMGATVAAFNIIARRENEHLERAAQRVDMMIRHLRATCDALVIEKIIEDLEALKVMLGATRAPALSESEGWLLMQCLKMVRDRQRQQPHVDSIEDNVAYAALYGEARLREVTK